MSATTSDLADRYGSTGPGRRRLIIVVSGVVGVLALVWVAWAAWFQGTPDVQSSLRSFTVLGDHSVRADVAVRTRSPGVRASCLLRASSEDHSVVGELNFKVAGADGTVVRRLELRTERAAVAVELVGCTSADQNQPR